MRRKKVGKKGRQPGWGGAIPGYNDFFSPSLSSGQSPRAAANQQPCRAVTQQPLLPGPPSPVGPWESGSGGQAPRRRPFCPEQPVFPPDTLLGSA